MVFTQEEEDILRLIINELRTRKKLDAERKKIETEFRDTWNPLRQQIDSAHQATLSILQTDFNNVEKAIEDIFK